MTTVTTRERPTIGALITAFATALLTWAWSAIPATVPTEVAATGYLLALGLVGVVIGKVVQGQLLGGLFGKRAPWADDTHRAAVAYALTLDPDEHAEELAAILERLGIDDVAEAARLVGLDPAAG